MSTMAVEFDDNETGGTLRQKLEQSLEENRQLKSDLAAIKAAGVLSSNGFDLVSPEDLANVELDQLEAKAQELQEQRQGERKRMVEDLFRKRGIAEDELDRAVDEFLAPPPGEAQEAPVEPADDPFARLRATGSGQPTPAVNVDQLHGPDAIRHALATKR